MDVNADLDDLDMHSARVLEEILSQHMGQLTPGLFGFLGKLKRRSSSTFTPLTPSSTPPRRQRSSTNAFDVCPQQDSQDDPDDNADPSDLDSDASYDVYVTQAMVQRRRRIRERARRKRRRLNPTEDDDGEYAPERGRTAERRRRRCRRSSRSLSSCHRGGVVVPPVSIQMNHSNTMASSNNASFNNESSSNVSSLNASSSNTSSSNAPSSDVSSPNVQCDNPLNISSSLRTACTTAHNSSMASPYVIYGDPHLAPIKDSLIRAVLRVAGQGLKLLEDEGYRTMWMTSVLRGQTQLMRATGENGEEGSLFFISNQCHRADNKVVGAQFARLMVLVTLAAKVQSYETGDNKNYLTTIWLRFLAPQKPAYDLETWCRWYATGKKWAMLGQAGGVYLMLLIIHARAVAAFKKATIQELSVVGYLFRQLNDGFTILPLIRHILRPLLLCLQHEFPLDTRQLLDTQTLGIDLPHVDLHDWDASDRFFGAFKMNSFRLPPRIRPLWQDDPWCEERTEGSQGEPLALGPRIQDILSLQPSSPLISPVPPPPDISFQTGAPTSGNFWQDVLAVLSRVNSPKHVKVTTSLNLALPQNAFKLRGALPSKTLKFTEEQRALASLAVEPETLDEFEKYVKKQLVKGFRPNPSAFVLYDRRVLLGSESDKFLHLLDANGVPFAISLPPVPKQYRMRVLLPEFTILDAYITSLPGSSQPAVYPLGGVVLNLNACTRGHRDHGDQTICLVLTAHEGTGAELVMVEPGVVVRTYTGDALVFRSRDITHLNLHYTGKRVSIVFHSDHDGSAWAKDRNGWVDKPYFY